MIKKKTYPLTIVNQYNFILFYFIFSGKHEYFWIGLNDLASEGKFTWISDHSSVAFKGWDPTNPSNSGGKEDCTEIHDVHWNDNNCPRRYNYICEKRIG